MEHIPLIQLNDYYDLPDERDGFDINDDDSSTFINKTNYNKCSCCYFCYLSECLKLKKLKEQKNIVYLFIFLKNSFSKSSKSKILIVFFFFYLYSIKKINVVLFVLFKRSKILFTNIKYW